MEDFLNIKPEDSVGLYAFRLTDDDVAMLSNWLKWAQTYPKCAVHFCVFEISKHGKNHIHALVDIDVLSTWRQQMHTHFERRWVGKGAYSCEKLKKEKECYLLYMCKGIRAKGPEVWYKLAQYTDEMVEAWYAKYWSDKPIEEDKTLLRKPKVSKPSWSEEVTKLIVKDNPGRHWRYNGHDVNELLEHYVMPMLGQGSKKLNPRSVADLVMGQLNALTGGRCEGLNSRVRRDGFPDLFG